MRIEKILQKGHSIRTSITVPCGDKDRESGDPQEKRPSGIVRRGGADGRLADHPRLGRIRGLPQPDRFGGVRAARAPRVGGAGVRGVSPSDLHRLLRRRLPPSRPLSADGAGCAAVPPRGILSPPVPLRPGVRGRVPSLDPVGLPGIRRDPPVGAPPPGGARRPGGSRAALLGEGVRRRPPPALSRHLRDPGVPPRPDSELPPLDRDDRPLLLPGDVPRGAPIGARVRGGVPELSEGRPPVPPAAPPPPAPESRRHPRVSNTGREKPKERGEPGWENRNLRWSSSPITSARSATSETGAWPGSRRASI